MCQMISTKEITFGPRIGVGGGGVVFKGLWNTHTVAIKKFLFNFKQSKIDREDFEREINNMTRLNHPSITCLYGIFQQNGKYSMVLEYAPNGDLSNLLQKNKSLSWPRKWQIAMDVVTALRHLHQRKIQHRDLKSGNVLIDQNYRAKVCDFGLSKFRYTPKTFEGNKNDIYGSTRWMAPETLLRPPKITYKSDVYALGIILWELVTHLTPFHNIKFPIDIEKAVSKGGRPPIPQNCPSVLRPVITTLWEQDHKKRPTAEGAFVAIKKAKLATEEAEKKRLSANTKALEQEYQKGVNCYIGRDYDTAAKHFKNAAALRHPQALYRLALCYEKGHGVIVIPNLVTLYLTMAANHNVPEAELAIALRYNTGKDVKQDHTLAAKYFKLAINHPSPNPLAQYHLGMLYYRGHGEKQNYTEAIKYLKLAADRVAMAAYYLGVCYQEEKGIKKDLSEAAKWFRLAMDLKLKEKK